jgi:hypothetical protein
VDGGAPLAELVELDQFGEDEVEDGDQPQQAPDEMGRAQPLRLLDPAPLTMNQIIPGSVTGMEVPGTTE